MTTISKKHYTVEQGTPEYTDVRLSTFDITEAYERFSLLEPQEDNSNHEYKSIEEHVVEFEIDEAEILEYIEDYEYTRDEAIEELIEGEEFEIIESENLEYQDFERANNSSDELIKDVEYELGRIFNKKCFKYFSLNDKNFRVADHSPNPSRLSNIDISIVISNKDQTSSKFNQSNKTTHFTSENTALEIVQFILNELKH